MDTHNLLAHNRLGRACVRRLPLGRRGPDHCGSPQMDKPCVTGGPGGFGLIRRSSLAHARHAELGYPELGHAYPTRPVDPRSLCSTWNTARRQDAPEGRSDLVRRSTAATRRRRRVGARRKLRREAREGNADLGSQRRQPRAGMSPRLAPRPGRDWTRTNPASKSGFIPCRPNAHAEHEQVQRSHSASRAAGRGRVRNVPRGTSPRRGSVPSDGAISTSASYNTLADSYLAW